VIGTFAASYLAGRTDLKARSIDRLTRSFNLLEEYFGSDRPLRDVTAGDTEEYSRKLRKKMAENTARKHLSNAKQLFRFAQRKQLISANPFADLKGLSSIANNKRDHFITREDAGKVLEACPNGQWRLLFALARFGGLRTPSESLGLTWNDIDWERNRMRVRSPKTERHAGKDERFVPIFPELRPHLDAEYHAAPDGAEYVITVGRAKGMAANLRTTMHKIIIRAGLKVWDKTFHNLRASRATELATEYPAHVAAEWLGHSTLVAQKHYWQVTEADFERATTKTDSGAPQAAQNPAQQVGEMECIGANAQRENCENAAECVISAASENGQHPQQDSNLRPAA
jgi:integrase